MAYTPHAPHRVRLPMERKSITHKFVIGDHEGYITAGMYEDGRLGEVFLTDVGKEGSTMRGMMDAFATMLSVSLQYGLPLEAIAPKFRSMKFDPSGPTETPEIKQAASIIDYIFRWLALRFGDDDLKQTMGVNGSV